jgi:hypothetical protein
MFSCRWRVVTAAVEDRTFDLLLKIWGEVGMIAVLRDSDFEHTRLKCTIVWWSCYIAAR